MGATAAPGQIVNRKYRVERVIGQGGMGLVVAAQHVALGQRVAIKFLHHEMLAHPEIVERFAREARAASRLESDHVARVIDVDVSDDGTPFIVMEYLDGEDLTSVRKGGQGLPVALAVGYILEACEAIGEAHRLGIVHRDIKPANLFLARRSDGRTRLKVLDFGISKLDVPGSDADVTLSRAILGSSKYMSPEQMLSASDVDGRSDIWSIGVTLYHLLTVGYPFSGDNVTQVFASVIEQKPAPPSSLRSDVPPGLDAVILRCLARKREDRYANVAELMAALAPYAQAVPAPPPSTPTLTPASKKWTSTEKFDRPASVPKWTSTEKLDPAVIARWRSVAGAPSPLAPTSAGIPAAPASAPNAVVAPRAVLATPPSADRPSVDRPHVEPSSVDRLSTAAASPDRAAPPPSVRDTSNATAHAVARTQNPAQPRRSRLPAALGLAMGMALLGGVGIATWLHMRDAGAKRYAAAALAANDTALASNAASAPSASATPDPTVSVAETASAPLPASAAPLRSDPAPHPSASAPALAAPPKVRLRQRAPPGSGSPDPYL